MGRTLTRVWTWPPVHQGWVWGALVALSVAVTVALAGDTWITAGIGGALLIYLLMRLWGPWTPSAPRS
jgi:hypothetical protein